VIFHGAIWSRRKRFAQSVYHGEDPHYGHVHVSILHTRRAETRRHHWLPDISAADVARRLVSGP
jgi:hypothetical protein